ncbi:hypothetical protein D3C80_1953650 [compost metagenome]
MVEICMSIPYQLSSTLKRSVHPQHKPCVRDQGIAGDCFSLRHALSQIGFILYGKESHGENVQSFSKEYDEKENSARRNPVCIDVKCLHHGRTCV